VIRWLSKVLISGWFLGFVVVGSLALLLVYYLFFDPIALRQETVECLIAVRIVDEKGVPIEGAEIGASADNVPMAYEVLGTTGDNGVLLAGILSPCSKRVYRLGEPRGLDPVSDFSIIVMTDGKRVLLPEKAHGLPTRIGVYAHLQMLRQEHEQPWLQEIPEWAADVEILHATIEL